MASTVSTAKLKSIAFTPSSRMARRSSMTSALLPENRNRSPLSAFAVAMDPKGERDACRIAADVGGQLAQALDRRPVARHGVEPMLRIGADRIPTVADSCGAAHCRPAFAADPQRRARLLHRLGGEQDVRKLDEAAVEPRLVLRPQLAKRHQILIGRCPALGKRRRTDGHEFLLKPAPTPTMSRPPDIT